MDKRENIILKCELKDSTMKEFSDSSSQEKIEVGDLNSMGVLLENQNLNSNSHSEYPEIFEQLSNTPLNWDLKIYEHFLNLSKDCIREVYNHTEIQAPNETVENCFKAMLSPLRLLRFLIGFNFNITNAFNAFNKHIKWRKEFNMDNVVRPYVITNMVPNNNIEMAPLHNIITRYYPCNLLLRESTHEKTPLKDFYGNIICIERFGLLDETRLLGAVKVEELLLWYSYHMEYRSILLDKLSYEAKSLVRATCIIDLFGLSLSQVHSSHMITILRRMIQLASDNYPEGMSYVVFVNSPKFFSIVWNSFKSLLAARTVEKILVLDEDYKTKLINIVPISNLPQFLGGLTTDQFSTVPNTGTLLLDCFGLGDDRQTLHIKRMKKEKVSISISKPNTKVFWTWGVLDGEISFSAKYFTDKILSSLNHDKIKNDFYHSDTDKLFNSNNTFLSDNYDNYSDFKINISSNSNDINYHSNTNTNRKSSKNLKKLSNNNISPIPSMQTLMNQEITLVPMSKFDSTKAYGGSYFSESPGYLVLQWDNSWSLFSGKTVHFVIKTSNKALHEDHNDNVSANNDNNDNDNDNINNGDNNNINNSDPNINNLSDISNLVSHNVALTNITKKRPSKSHKSVEKKRVNSKRSSKMSNKSMSIAIMDNHLSIPNMSLNKNYNSHSLLKSIKKGKRDYKYEENNTVNYPEERLNKVFNENDRNAISSIINDMSQVYDSSINYENDSNSECQTNSSFVTAYSKIDEILDLFEYNKNSLLNLNTYKRTNNQVESESIKKDKELHDKSLKTFNDYKLAVGVTVSGMNSNLVKSQYKSGQDKHLVELERNLGNEKDDDDYEDDDNEDGSDEKEDSSDEEGDEGDDNREKVKEGFNSSQLSLDEIEECDLLVDSLTSSNCSNSIEGSFNKGSNLVNRRLQVITRNLPNNNQISLETSINIFGFENFGFESSQICKKRHEELLNYINCIELQQEYIKNQEFFSPQSSFDFTNRPEKAGYKVSGCHFKHLRNKFTKIFTHSRKNKSGMNTKPEDIENNIDDLLKNTFFTRIRNKFNKKK
ncbi:CRAL TRIO domain-containing [Cryptosporidium sp. chipmunk genotype I]|uniref:CRAL TRIO domain-containing n=1 Tax=Cryptosporidium sp. chipmunk genotype I TaxID=1280935 RepID=UPI003519DBD8|nr:CRAL TRIO domain-containing [Cryptosporidium sp. chipmunk genotype I]